MRRLTALLLLCLSFSCTQNRKVVVYPTKPKEECSYTYRVKGKTYCVKKDHKGFVQVGIASWYGPGFHGSRTASGEIYNMYKLTAAHKTLPLGTYVKVINLENGKSVIVKINDRGPFVKGRIIDLSYAAAKKLGMLKKGTAKVKIIALGKRVNHHYSKVSYTTGKFYVQLGAFKNKFYAYKFRSQVEKKFKIKASVFYLRGYYRVLAGPVKSLQRAEKFKDRLRKLGLRGSFIVRL